MLRYALPACVLVLFGLAGGCAVTVSEHDLFFAPELPLDDWVHPPQVQGVVIRPVEVGQTPMILRGWLFVPENPTCSMVYFYGTGETARSSMGRLSALARNLGCRILTVDYRGAGFTRGRAGFDTLKQDSLDSYDKLVSLSGDETVFVYGRSLGTVMALHVTTNRKVGGLILEAPPTSASDVVPAFVNLLPAPKRWFIRARPDKKLSERGPQPIEQIALVSAPLLVIQGQDDKIVSPRFGRRMYDMAGTEVSEPGDKLYLAVPRAGHEDLDPNRPAVVGAIRRFMNSVAR